MGNEPKKMTDRPKLCLCPNTCSPIRNSMVLDPRIKDQEADMTQGYSGECIGKMSENVTFIYGGAEHQNDLNHCIFTPLKGIIRYQENWEDIGSSLWLLQSALDVLRPLKCEHCGEESRIFAQIHDIVDRDWLEAHPNLTSDEYNNAPRRRFCTACCVHLGYFKPHPENFGKQNLAKYY